MTKAELKLLEKIYEGEIISALSKEPLRRIFQSKSKLLAKLEEEGYVKRVEEKIPGPFQVTILGWELTTAGNLAYCRSCDGR
jgi:predicted methyltransferase